MAIEYKTEGKAVVECPKGRANPVAMTWLKGNTVVALHQGSRGPIELSAHQLRQIRDLVNDICADLED